MINICINDIDRNQQNLLHWMQNAGGDGGLFYG